SGRQAMSDDLAALDWSRLLAELVHRAGADHVSWAAGVGANGSFNLHATCAALLQPLDLDEVTAAVSAQVDDDGAAERVAELVHRAGAVYYRLVLERRVGRSIDHRVAEVTG